MFVTSRTGSAIDFLNLISDNNDTPTHSMTVCANARGNIMPIKSLPHSGPHTQNEQQYQSGAQSMTLPGTKMLPMIIYYSYILHTKMYYKKVLPKQKQCVSILL